MAKGVKTGGKDFQKGKPGGPGRPKLLPEADGLPKLDRDSFGRILNEALVSKIEDSKRIVEDDSESNIRRWMHGIAIKGMKESDVQKLSALLDRAIGKVKDQVEHSGKLSLEEIISSSYKNDE